MIPHILSNLVKQIHSRFILSRFLRRSSLFFLGGLIGFCVLILVIGGSYYLHYQQMIFPGVMLGPVQVGELTKTQAADKLNSAINNYRDSWPAKFELKGNIYEITYPFQSVTYNVDLSVAQAFNVGRRWSLESLPILFQLTKSSYEVPLSPVIDEDWLNREAASLSAQIDPLS